MSMKPTTTSTTVTTTAMRPIYLFLMKNVRILINMMDGGDIASVEKNEVQRKHFRKKTMST